MKICKIWDADYPWDVRVQKVASSLSDAGHRVHIVARNRKRLLLEEHLPEGWVHRLAPLPLIGRRLNSASMFPAFFNPRWIRIIQGTARRVRADLILVRDLPLAPSAIWISRSLGLPIVLDMAENYPAMMRSLWDNGVQRPLDILVRNPAIIHRLERWVVHHVNHILVVVEESKDRLVAMGVSPERITLVSNTPPLARLLASAPREHPSGTGGPMEIIYLGLLEVPRGLRILIDAVSLSRRAGTPVSLTVIGEGRERIAFEKHAQRLGLGPNVIRFMGYIPSCEALQLLHKADIGIVPHLANDSWNTTIPNKLFDYMAAGLAVLTSDAKPTARIVRETGAGEVYMDNDPIDLAAALGRLANPHHRVRCSAAGLKAVRSTYHWESDAKRLIRALELVKLQHSMAIRALERRKK